MPAIQPTNINAYYADLETAKVALVNAQNEVARCEQAVRDAGGEVPGEAKKGRSRPKNDEAKDQAPADVQSDGGDLPEGYKYDKNGKLRYKGHFATAKDIKKLEKLQGAK